MLAPGAQNDPDQQSRINELQNALRDLGWTEQRTVRIDVRLTAGNTELFRAYASELVALKPDLLFADASPSTAALQHETSVIPIVFARVTDPVGQGFVANMARPGGNITGFTNYEHSMGGKWLELLKEAVPSIKRTALIYNPQTAPYTPSFMPSFQAAARANAVTPVDAPVRDADELEAAIAAQGRDPGGSLLLQTDSFLVVHRDLIVVSAARYRLPSIFPASVYVGSGGLLAYASDNPSMYRGTAGYVDRILRGTKPADLPVQGPTKFTLSVNLKTAKALGLTIPESFLLRADEIIE
jgi:putative ABC transport system substrate-binding protein